MMRTGQGFTHPWQASGAVRALAATLLAFICGTAVAQTWPTRPVRVIVPFPPGNASDIMARAISDRLGTRLGQAVVVENRGGASGIIGADAVAKAAPDGYTVLLSTISPVTINPVIFRKLPYDVERDLVAVVQLGYTPFMLVSHPGVPAANVDELVKHARAHAGKLSYASVGQGSMSQLLMALFSQALSLDMVHVPYKGSGQALTDMIGGQVQLMFDGMTSANTQVLAGKLRGYAVTSIRRASTAPTLPTLNETKIPGLEDFDVVGWMGLFVPTGTPRAIIDRLNSDAMAALQFQEVRERLAAQSVEISGPNTPEQFAAYHRKELARWRQVGKSSGVAGTQ